MANRFLDSFEHYVSSEIPLKWTQDFSASIDTTFARTGNNSIFLQTGGAGGVASVSKTIDYQNTWYVGFAIYMPSSSSGLSGGGTCYELLSNASVLLSVVINSDFTVSLSTPNNGGIFATTTGYSLHSNAWYYLEVSAVLSTGVTVTAVLRINKITMLTGTHGTGVPDINLIDGATANRHIFEGLVDNPAGLYMDDIYINDGQAPANASFWGDVNIYCLYPASDSSVMFSIFPTTPTTHFDKVDENPPDGDTTYIYSNTVSDSDNFIMQTLSTFTGTVMAVQFLAYARKDDAGTRTFKHLVNGNFYSPGTGGVLGCPEFSVSSDYVYYIANFDQDPTTGAAWTVAGFNSDNFGVRIIE